MSQPHQDDRAPEAEAAKRASIFDGLAEKVERKVAEEPFRRDTGFLEVLVPLMRIWGRYFDGEVRGMDRLPAEGPMLLVGNHSGGLLVPDTAVLIAAWYEARGFDNPLVGLAFDGMFALPGMESLMRRLGEVPANHENAGRALDEGAAVLVYPGGARETFRPWTARNQIDFSGNRGFVKLALRKQVPVVPVVGHGGQETLVVLSRGEAVARALGLERLRLDILPLAWQLPFGLSIPILPGIPLPVKITVEVMEPMDWSHFGPDDADDPEVVDACYEEITSAMQATLDGLAAEHPIPLLSRLRSLVGLG